MYPAEMVLPMKEDLTNVGFEQLIDSESVDQFLTQESGTLLVVVNSVCGCAAGNMRPGVKLSLQHSKKPEILTTVFAGVDTCLLYTSPSPRDRTRSRMPSSA